MNLTKERVEKILVEVGHAINANNGKCSLIQDVLCDCSTLAVKFLEILEASWQPISTAPKESPAKIILLFIPKDDGNWEIGSGNWDQYDECWMFNHRNLREWDFKPTHWQPLPQPPKETT